MAMFKLIPLLCTHVYLYMFSRVHPPSDMVQRVLRWERQKRCCGRKKGPRFMAEKCCYH